MLQGPRGKRHALPARPGRAPGKGLPGPSTHPRPSAPRLEDDGIRQAHMGLNWSVVSWVGSVYSHAKPPPAPCWAPGRETEAAPSRSGPQRAGRREFPNILPSSQACACPSSGFSFHLEASLICVMIVQKLNWIVAPGITSTPKNDTPRQLFLLFATK